MSIDKEQRLALKAKAHHLKPVVLLGNQGLTEAVHTAIDEALEDHELIKIKLAGTDREDRNELADQICQHHQAHYIHSIGQMLIIYRKSNKQEQKAKAKKPKKKPAKRTRQR